MTRSSSRSSIGSGVWATFAFPDEGPSMREEALALLQKGIILFQRKVYDGAMRTLTEYRHHLHGRSPDTTELRIATGLLGSRYGIADLVAQKSSGRDIAHAFPFRTLAAVDARGICITDSLARSICIDIG